MHSDMEVRHVTWPCLHVTEAIKFTVPVRAVIATVIVMVAVIAVAVTVITTVA